MNWLVFINLLCCGIVTGVYIFEMVVVVPAVNAAPTQLLSAQIHAALFSHLPNRFMPWLGISGGLAAVALLLFEDDLSDSATALYAIGVACWVATFVILVGMSRGIDKTITRWVETSLPEAEYPATRKRWDGLMYTRGPLGLAALSCFIAAALS